MYRPLGFQNGWSIIRWFTPPAEIYRPLGFWRFACLARWAFAVLLVSPDGLGFYADNCESAQCQELVWWPGK